MMEKSNVRGTNALILKFFHPRESNGLGVFFSIWYIHLKALEERSVLPKLRVPNSCL